MIEYYVWITCQLIHTQCCCIPIQEILKGFGLDVEPGKLFLDALQDHSKPAILESSFLVHQPVELTKINKHLWESFLPWKELPINSIRDYFGTYVCIYLCIYL